MCRATYPQRNASVSKTFLSFLVAGRKDKEDMWTHICIPSQGKDSILPYVVTRKSVKVAKHIQIRRLVGRRTQAKAASNRQRRSLFFESEILLTANPGSHNQLCFLIGISWIPICAQTVFINLIVFFCVHRPLPRPEIQRNDGQGCFKTIRKRARRAEPLPGTADGEGELENQRSKRSADALIHSIGSH